MEKENLIVILNYVNYSLTINCVEQLRSNQSDHDVLIVDNCSPNDSFACLQKRFFGEEHVFLIRTAKNGGYSYGNNCGLRWGAERGYQSFCIMNPDVVIKDPDFFQKLLAVMRDNQEIAVVSGMQIYANNMFGQFLNYWDRPGKLKGLTDHSFIDFFRKTVPPPVRIEKDAFAYVDVLSGCCFMIRTDVIEKVGYLDENVFLFYEENILSQKIHAAGYKEAICVNTTFFHNHASGAASVKKRMREKVIQLRSRKYYYRTCVSGNPVLNALQTAFSAVDYCLTALVYSLYGVLIDAHRKNDQDQSYSI